MRALRAAREVRLLEVLAVNFVHIAELFHVGNEDIELDDLITARPSGFEHGCQVLDDLVL